MCEQKYEELGIAQVDISCLDDTGLSHTMNIWIYSNNKVEIVDFHQFNYKSRLLQPSFRKEIELFLDEIVIGIERYKYLKT